MILPSKGGWNSLEHRFWDLHVRFHFRQGGLEFKIPSLKLPFLPWKVDGRETILSFGEGIFSGVQVTFRERINFDNTSWE